jgi:hypothetical protein
MLWARRKPPPGGFWWIHPRTFQAAAIAVATRSTFAGHDMDSAALTTSAVALRRQLQTQRLRAAAGGLVMAEAGRLRCGATTRERAAPIGRLAFPRCGGDGTGDPRWAASPATVGAELFGAILRFTH